MTASAGDGRNVDPSLGVLEGEAAEQRVPERREKSEGASPFAVWTGVPSGAGERRQGPTYYDRPVLKEPTWIWAVPAYFYAGGAAGAAATLGAAAQVLGGGELRGLVRRCRWIAAAGGAIGTACLIYDLGRPERFLNMLRVFRPSSPMNVGSWILAGCAPLAAGSAVLADAPQPLRALGDLAGFGAGLLGGPLAGYTGVLISNTAVPVWQATRRTTPPLFIASGVSAAASLLQMTTLSSRESRLVKGFAIAGAASEIALHATLEREAGAVEEVSKPLHEGPSGALVRVGKVCSGLGMALSLLPFGGRARRILAGLFGTAGALALKFGIFEAGKASARNPRATFAQRRAGRGAAEIS